MPGQKVDQEHAENVWDKADDCDPSSAVRNTWNNCDAGINRYDLYRPRDAAKECSLQWSKTEWRDDDLKLGGDRIQNTAQSWE